MSTCRTLARTGRYIENDDPNIGPKNNPKLSSFIGSFRFNAIRVVFA